MPTVTHAIIHQIKKEAHGKAEHRFRDDENELNENTNKLVQKIYEHYCKHSSKGFGRFEEDEINFPFQGILRKFYCDHSSTFSETSRDLIRHLAYRADQAQLSTGGYVLISELEEAPELKIFIVVIITNSSGSLINNQLEVAESEYIDFRNVRVAGRVDVNDWLTGSSESQYASFLKHSGDVAAYFYRFLGCTTPIKNKDETLKLHRVLKGYAHRNSFSDERRNIFMHSAHDYCETCSKSANPISFDTLANILCPEDPEPLKEWIALSETKISDGFVPDRQALKDFVRIKAITSAWTLELERSALRSGDITYIPADAELRIRNLPDSLRNELETEIS